MIFIQAWKMDDSVATRRERMLSAAWRQFRDVLRAVVFGYTDAFLKHPMLFNHTFFLVVLAAIRISIRLHKQWQVLERSETKAATSAHVGLKFWQRFLDWGRWHSQRATQILSASGPGKSGKASTPVGCFAVSSLWRGSLFFARQKLLKCVEMHWNAVCEIGDCQAAVPHERCRSVWRWTSTSAGCGAIHYSGWTSEFNRSNSWVLFSFCFCMLQIGVKAEYSGLEGHSPLSAFSFLSTF